MPRKKTAKRSKPPYWWLEEILQLCKEWVKRNPPQDSLHMQQRDQTMWKSHEWANRQNRFPKPLGLIERCRVRILWTSRYENTRRRTGTNKWTLSETIRLQSEQPNSGCNKGSTENCGFFARPPMTICVDSATNSGRIKKKKRWWSPNEHNSILPVRPGISY